MNKTVGNVSVTFSDKRLEQEFSKAHEKLNMQIVADCTPLVPFLNGALRSSVRYPEGVKGDYIEWDTPYAHYMYEGELYLAENGSSWAQLNEKKYPAGKDLVYHHAGTGSHWFDKAKESNNEKWVNTVRKAVSD